MGATQNSHNCSNAQPPTKSAGRVERAGFTEVLVTGMLMTWMRVSAKPMGMAAKPADARRLVAPRITKIKPAVSTNSATSADNNVYLRGEYAP